ncbi:MAG: hypothetical protein RQ847_00415, partial [Wenzhouxiangellaceae bacterium]|nr:hypothetical protein [Wenzhouxiangellaceae bacterium]
MGSLQEALLKSGLAREDRTGHGRNRGSTKGPGKGNANGRKPDAGYGSRDRQRKSDDRRRLAGKNKSDPGKTDLERAWAERRK